MNRAFLVLAGALICAGLIWAVGTPEIFSASAAKPASEPTSTRVAANDSGAVTNETTAFAPENPLEETSWRLVHFQSMDDTIGTLRPQDPSLYTMRLNRDGTVTMRLNCNRARGTWSATPGNNATSGHFEFGPLATTRALCPPPRLDEQIAAQSGFIRSYLLKNDRLYLSMKADGGIYAWEREAGEPAASSIPAAPEDGGPRNWEVTGVATRLNLRQQPSTAAAIVSTYASGTLLDNLGCERVAGQAWCDVQQLGGGPRGYVAAEFLKPAISPDGTAAIAGGHRDIHFPFHFPIGTNQLLDIA